MTEVNDIAAKVKRYEAFLNDRLKKDLKDTLDARDKVYQTIADYLKLATHIETIQSNNLSELKTMVDLGSNFYVQAKVPDTTHVYVDIGYNFHAQLTLKEALDFIEKKEKLLKRRAETFTQEAAKIRAHIVMVLEALAEIMKLEYGGQSRGYGDRDVWGGGVLT